MLVYPKKWPSLSNSGFTLMEIMIVVAIMAAIVGLVLPRIDSRNNQLKSEMRRLTTLTRQVRNLAKLQNSTFRLVIDMKEGPESESSHEFWIERANGEFLISEDREQAYMDQLDADREAKDTEDEKPASDFSPDTSIIKGSKSLPSDMIFENIEVPGIDNPVTEGKVYVHFFPSGLSEEVAIHLKLGESQWTLAVHPLTGKSDIVAKYMSLKEIKDQ